MAWGAASTYELVKAICRNPRYTRPRAESQIYEEARRLVHSRLALAPFARGSIHSREVVDRCPPGRPTSSTRLDSPASLPLRASTRQPKRAFLRAASSGPSVLGRTGFGRARSRRMGGVRSAPVRELLASLRGAFITPRSSAVSGAAEC